MKRKYASLLLAMSLTACMFVGCGSKDVDDPSKEAKPTQGVSQETVVTQAPVTEDNQVAPVTQEPVVEVPEKYEAPLETVTVLKNYKYYGTEGSRNPREETSYDYETDINGNLVRMRIYESTSSTTTEYSFKYSYFEDDKVQKVMKYKITKNGEQLSSEREYDTKGNLIKYAAYSVIVDEEDKVSKETVYRYNETGVLVQETTKDYDEDEYEEEIIDYNESGVPIQKVEIKTEDDRYEVKTTVYDELGRKIKTIMKTVRYDDGETKESEKTSEYTYTVEETDSSTKLHTFHNEKEVSVVEYEYDFEGRLVKESIEENSHNSFWWYEYNDAGVMIKKTQYRASENSFGIPKEVYEYDDSGYLLRATTLNYSGSTINYEYIYNYITVRNWNYIAPFLNR